MDNKNPEHIRTIIERVFPRIQKAYEDQRTEMVDREKADYADSQSDGQEIIP